MVTFNKWIVPAIRLLVVTSLPLPALADAADPAGASAKSPPGLAGAADGAITATGSIKLRVGADVRVGAQISGIVRQLNVTVGSRVRKGDLIAVIDARGLEERIESAKAQVAVDEASLKQARDELTRKTALHTRGVVSDEEFATAGFDAERAAATLAKARADLSVQTADEDYLRIRAPIDGIVASVSTQEGETVVAAFAAPTFVNIIKPEALELIALVDETDIAQVRLGGRARFAVESYPSREFAGMVTRIAPTATIVSGVVNYEVTVALRDEDTRLLKPEMTANLEIAKAGNP